MGPATESLFPFPESAFPPAPTAILCYTQQTVRPLENAARRLEFVTVDESKFLYQVSPCPDSLWPSDRYRHHRSYLLSQRPLFRLSFSFVHLRPPARPAQLARRARHGCSLHQRGLR